MGKSSNWRNARVDSESYLTNAAHNSGDLAQNLAIVAIDWFECGVGGK